MILDEIVADKKVRLAAQKQDISPDEMRRAAEAAVKKGREEKRQGREKALAGLSPEEQERENPFYQALAKPGISIIGEFKKASPSLGKIRTKVTLSGRMEAYNASVDAISCLTEEDHFLGSTEYLREIREMSPLPILRKDFMIDSYQFYEAKAIGADGVLLIAAILEDGQMEEFYSLAKELGLAALVEVHDEREVERALKLGAQIIGVNNRDLKNFSIHLDTTRRLSHYIPEEKIFVTESGITRDEDVKFLTECKVDAFLIGRALMESEYPRRLAERWKSL